MQAIYDYIRAELIQTLDPRLEIDNQAFRTEVGTHWRLCVDTKDPIILRDIVLNHQSQRLPKSILYPGYIRLLSIQIVDGEIGIRTTNSCARVCRLIGGEHALVPILDTIDQIPTIDQRFKKFPLADPNSIDNAIEFARTSLVQLMQIIETCQQFKTQ